jgi:hypothetical protein
MKQLCIWSLLSQFFDLGNKKDRAVKSGEYRTDEIIL